MVYLGTYVIIKAAVFVVLFNWFIFSCARCDCQLFEQMTWWW